VIADTGQEAGQAANITGQATGVGGDRLQVWHPTAASTEYRDGGLALRGPARTGR